MSVKYEDIEKAVREWGSGNEVQYDFNGVVHLLIAALDNLRAHALEAELEDVGESFEPEQAEFLMRLSRYVEAG